MAVAPDGTEYTVPSFLFDKFSDSSASFVIQIPAAYNIVVSGPQKKFFLNCTTATFIEVHLRRVTRPASVCNIVSCTGVPRLQIEVYMP